MIKTFCPISKRVLKSAKCYEVHAIEYLILHLCVGHTFSKWFETTAKVVSALLVNGVDNVLCADLLSGTLCGVFVVLQVPHSPA